MIKYTERYLSKNWIIIINEYIKSLDEKYNLGKEIYSFGEYEKQKMEKIRLAKDETEKSKKIRKLLEIMEKTINKQNEFSKNRMRLLKYKYYYLNKLENIVIIELKKNKEWNTLNYYQQDLNYNNDKIDLIIKFDKNENIINLNLNRLNKIKLLDAKSNELEYSKTKIPNIKLKTNKDLENKLKIKKEIEFEELTKKCVFNKPLDYLKNFENMHQNELNCVNIGGLWDKPCSKNKDCPFNISKTRGECNKNTGYCEMPEGIERIGYTYYNNDKKAKCLDKNNKIIKCENNNKDNNFKWEIS